MWTSCGLWGSCNSEKAQQMVISERSPVETLPVLAMWERERTSTPLWRSCKSSSKCSSCSAHVELEVGAPVARNTSVSEAQARSCSRCMVVALRFPGSDESCWGHGVLRSIYTVNSGKTCLGVLMCFTYYTYFQRLYLCGRKHYLSFPSSDDSLEFLEPPWSGWM